MAGNGAPAAAEPLRLRADDEPNVQNAILLAAASGSTGEGCKALDGGITCASIPALIYDQRSKSEGNGLGRAEQAASVSLATTWERQMSIDYIGADSPDNSCASLGRMDAMQDCVDKHRPSPNARHLHADMLTEDDVLDCMDASVHNSMNGSVHNRANYALHENGHEDVRESPHEECSSMPSFSTAPSTVAHASPPPLRSPPLPNPTQRSRTPARRPLRIILVRHGQSLGNVDEAEYRRTPDWKVELTPKGHQQARDAGRALDALLSADGARRRVFVYSSPYKRCKQTLQGLLEGARLSYSELLGHREEPRIREQDFGNFQDPDKMREAKQQRERFGRFFYRFPNGESGADVYDRVSTWLETLYRDMEFGLIDRDTTVVLVTHGLISRVFLMRWYHWSVDVFEQIFNPSNAALLVMTRDTYNGGTYYRLSTEAMIQLRLPQALQEEFGRSRLPLSPRPSFVRPRRDRGESPFDVPPPHPRPAAEEQSAEGQHAWWHTLRDRFRDAAAKCISAGQNSANACKDRLSTRSYAPDSIGKLPIGDIK